MPHFSVAIGPIGPILSVLVGVSAPRKQALTAAGQPVPSVAIASLLIDTGASITCVDSSVLTALGIQPTGTIGILTPSTGPTPHQVSTYDVELTIPGGHTTAHIIPAIAVADGHYLSQGIQGLLGRDILRFARLMYSGFDNHAMLSL